MIAVPTVLVSGTGTRSHAQQNETENASDMMESISNLKYVLFVMTNSEKCAVSLPHGNSPITGDAYFYGRTQSPYFSTAVRNALHDTWTQKIYPWGWGTYNKNYKKDVMIITWKFDTVKTVEDRFSSAVKSGERVKWTIQFDSGRGQTITKSQDWYAKGAWGGASGRAVNGDSNVPNDFYGQGNWNSRDYWCNGLWVNGVYTKRDKIQVFVYVQVIGTRTTTTTTTTMTTLLSVLLKTFMLPEFSSWVIKDVGGKQILCKGSGQASWYSTIKVNCKLAEKNRTGLLA